MSLRNEEIRAYSDRELAVLLGTLRSYLVDPRNRPAFRNALERSGYDWKTLIERAGREAEGGAVRQEEEGRRR